jgi:hypothetical protein
LPDQLTAWSLIHDRLPYRLVRLDLRTHFL